MINLYNDDCLNVLKNMKDESVNCVITSPPYFQLRDYKSSLGNEDTVDEYIDNLIKIFNQVYRVLKSDGACWVNIDDTYKDKCLLCVPDKFKIKMIENGWICRNEIIWHKPNAMPCSCKDRFNNDYEKFFFFVKNENYYFDTQYEDCKSINNITRKSSNHNYSKYEDVESESLVRQGLNKNRGNGFVYLRKNLPTKEDFLLFIKNADKKQLYSLIERTTVDHWFRKDNGFSFPKVDDWNKIKHLVSHFDNFNEIDIKLTDITVETDDILKNIDKGRIKRTVWDICTKPNEYKHYATFPKELVITPINACTKKNDVVMDIFMGSGTVGEVCNDLERSFIGIELNEEYFHIAENRIKNTTSLFEV